MPLRAAFDYCLNNDVSMRSHVSRTVSGGDVLLCYDSFAASDVQCPTPCFSRWLCRWSCHVSTMATTLAGLPTSQLRRLQSVLNAAARQIHRSSRYKHVTPMLRDLHWLRTPERIDFKLAVLVYRCLHGLAPWYLSDHIQLLIDSNCRHLQSSFRWSCVSGGRIPPFEQSAIWYHVSSNAHCFSKSPQNPSLVQIIFFITVNYFRFCSLHREQLWFSSLVLRPP